MDRAAMLGLVEYAIRCGVSGVVFPGFASEVEHLTSQERGELLAEVARAADGRVQVVVGASGASEQEVISHGVGAGDLGIEWLMIQLPKHLGSQADTLIGFLSVVAAALPKSRIILQNAPAPRGADLSADTILDLVRAVPQIAYVKEETLPAGPAISRILSEKPDSLLGVIGGGGARYILDEYARGACAAMPAIEIAELHVELDAAWRAGNHARAREIYVRTLPLLTLQAVYRMRLTKHVMMRRGILKNAIVRAPTPALDDISTADIDRNLAELDILDMQPGLKGISA